MADFKDDLLQEMVANQGNQTTTTATDTTAGADNTGTLVDNSVKTTPATQTKTEEPVTTAVPATTAPATTNFAYPDYLDEETTAADTTQANKQETDTKSGEDKYKEVIARATEYDELSKNELVKAVLEYAKNGGNNPDEFIKGLGITDVNQITIEDLYKAKAKEIGLSGEKADKYVEGKVSKFETMDESDRIEEEHILRSKAESIKKEKLSQFTASQSQRGQQNAAEEQALTVIKDTSRNTLTEKVNGIIGKNMMGLKIEESMKNDLFDAAASLSFPVYKDGKLIGYDVERGLRLGLFDKFGKQLLRANIDYARSEGYNEHIQERNRPSENLSRSGGAGQTANQLNKSQEMDSVLDSKYERKVGKK